MMGVEGLTRATEAAVLGANYLAAKLRDAFPVLYTGDAGLVAHECILDLRPLREATGITVDDVAKRLVDYGFHAPTMSFPVAGTLMVEPTESEDLAELDRFVDAMLAIRAEADEVAAGTWPADDNPLVHAPHTAASVIAGDWTHAYNREQAVYPLPGIAAAKYLSLIHISEPTRPASARIARIAATKRASSARSSLSVGSTMSVPGTGNDSVGAWKP